MICPCWVMIISSVETLFFDYEDGYSQRWGNQDPAVGRQGVENQRQYLRHILDHDMSFGIGPAGTGKTYLAVAAAVDALERDLVKRIVLTRPAVEAGERLGFLPGETVRILTAFSHTYLGDQVYMVHCHNLEHEDAGMMAVLEVRPR